MTNTIFIHHTGGINRNNFASSAHLTVESVDRAHRSMFGLTPDIDTHWSGYNFIYDPKNRSITLTRPIGAQTAAQKGHNYQISIATIGNHNMKNGKPVDKIHPNTITDLTALCKALVLNRHQYEIKLGTQLNLSAYRIHPHRFVRQTDCYGTGINNNFFRDLVIKDIRNDILGQLQILLARIHDLYSGNKMRRMSFGSESEYECTGNLVFEQLHGPKRQ